MPSSPRTPNRRRKSSNLESPFSPSSPQTNGYSSRPSHSRKSSLNSIRSSLTTRPTSSHSRNGDFGSSNGFGSATDGGNGLGNLADELAEAWDDEGEEGVDTRSPGGQFDGYGDLLNGHTTPPQLRSPSSISNHIPSSPIPNPTSRSLSPMKQSARSKHRQRQSQYDGSDYGSDPEEVDGISPSLEARMAAIEHLARRETEANGIEADTVISRVAESLRDLGSQSSLETGASR